MTRIFQTGFEIPVFIASTGGYTPDGRQISGSALMERSTDYVRTGTYSGKVGVVNSANTVSYSFATSNNVYCRFYFLKTANPASTIDLMIIDVSKLRINSSGQLIVSDSANNQKGSPSSALDNGVWYMVEFGQESTVGIGRYVFGRLEGSQFATGQVSPTTGTSSALGIYAAFGITAYYDDLAINNESGAVHDSWPGPGKVLLLLPIGDSQDGTWTLASGGNTNLYDAINNSPPTCSAASDANRIESVDSSGNNATDELLVSLGSYTSNGVSAGATINAILPWVLAGEEVGTGTKSISFGLYYNPIGSLNAVADVTSGTSGAVGTYPTAWWWFPGSVVENPSVDLGVAASMNLRKTDTGTRSATVGFLGAYVDYTPAPVPTSFPFRHPSHNLAALLAM